MGSVALWFETCDPDLIPGSRTRSVTLPYQEQTLADLIIEKSKCHWKQTQKSPNDVKNKICVSFKTRYFKLLDT